MMHQTFNNGNEGIVIIIRTWIDSGGGSERMKNHVLRPLFVFIGIVVLVLVARYLYVPKDFGV